MDVAVLDGFVCFYLVNKIFNFSYIWFYIRFGRMKYEFIYVSICIEGLCITTADYDKMNRL